MKSKELFKLGVRLLGLVFVYHGLMALPTAIVAIVPGTHVSIAGGFIFAIFLVVWPLVVAYWLLRGAPLLMRIAYPDEHTAGEHHVVGVGEKKADA